MLTELLQLGLSDEEAKVYLAALEVNGGPVSVIARKAGVHRVSCYHTLENLLEKRLLSQQTKNGVKYFTPEPPEQLERIAQEKVATARKLLPELRTLTSSLAFRPRIRTYEGREGVERIFQESLRFAERKNPSERAGLVGPAREDTVKGKRESVREKPLGLSLTPEILGYTNLQTVTEFFPEFSRDYTAERFAKGIKSRYLSPNTVESVHVIDPFLPKTYDPNLIEILLVNKDQFPFENEVLIFGNTVGIVSLNRDELLGLLVESATLSRTMKAVFDLAWLGATAFVAK